MVAKKMVHFQNLTDEEFKVIRSHVKLMLGIDIEDSEKNYSLLNSRLGKVVYKYQMGSFANLIREIDVRNPEIIEEFISSVTTHTTRFFRESQHFDFLESDLKKKVKSGEFIKEELKIWCAAVSTGEEAYSIALICERIKNLYPEFKYKILATDVDTLVLKIAKKGLYGYDKIEQIPPDYINPSMFSIVKDSNRKFFKLGSKIKSNITFAKLNLINYCYNIHKHFDYIFCRNVFIYFKNEEVYNIIEKMKPFLKVNGLLFLGHSEANLGKFHDLEVVMPAVFKKKEV